MEKLEIKTWISSFLIYLVVILQFIRYNIVYYQIMVGVDIIREGTSMEIVKIDEVLKDRVRRFIVDNWGSEIIVSKGKVHKIDVLPGFVALENEKIQGLITYHIEKGECEIVSLDSLIENRGIGSELIAGVERAAVELECKRIWLITTNDNIRAMKFYQKRGYDMCGLHLNAVHRAREIKPEIPKVGFHGIYINHEIEFQKNSYNCIVKETIK